VRPLGATQAGEKGGVGFLIPPTTPDESQNNMEGGKKIRTFFRCVGEEKGRNSLLPRKKNPESPRCTPKNQKLLPNSREERSSPERP